MNPFMLLYIGGRAAASVVKRRLQEQRRRARNATGLKKHLSNWASGGLQRDNEKQGNRQGE